MTTSHANERSRVILEQALQSDMANAFESTMVSPSVPLERARNFDAVGANKTVYGK
jgi:hypothetical protein